MVEYLFDDDIWCLRCGGYDFWKVYVVYDIVCKEENKLIVILVKIVKGWILGTVVEGKNIVY